MIPAYQYKTQSKDIISPNKINLSIITCSEDKHVPDGCSDIPTVDVLGESARMINLHTSAAWCRHHRCDVVECVGIFVIPGDEISNS